MKGYDEYLKMRRQQVGRPPYEWQDHVAEEHWPTYVSLTAKYREPWKPSAADTAWCARELGDVPYLHTYQGIPVEVNGNMDNAGYLQGRDA